MERLGIAIEDSRFPWIDSRIFDLDRDGHRGLFAGVDSHSRDRSLLHIV